MDDVRNLLTNSIDDPRLGCIDKDTRLPHHLARFGLRDPFLEFISVLESFRLATYNAIEQVDEPGRGSESSDAWNIWIQHLHAVVANEQRGHGHLASFVRMVESF